MAIGELSPCVAPAFGSNSRIASRPAPRSRPLRLVRTMSATPSFALNASWNAEPARPSVKGCRAAEGGPAFGMFKLRKEFDPLRAMRDSRSSSLR
jgi:hypothetical protein